MFDFGRLVLNETKTPARQPVVITATPGWGYEGVFAGLGYRSRHVPLRARDGYQPRWREFQRLLMGEDDVKLVIINAQHNPTAANWSESAVREIIRSSVAAGAAILLDDAYFAVHDPNVKPTSALRILLEELSALPPETRPIWLAVRSLGKQFHCNGWGIGAITGHPATVDRLVNQVRFERTFVNAVPLQYAMAAWLQDPASDLYLEQMRSEYYRKRCAVADYLADNLAYPPRAYYRGECTAFLRFEVPKRFSQLGAEDFRADCFRSTGVMLSLDSSPEQVSKAGMASKAPCVRIFLGPSLNHLLEGLDRLQQAGFQYQ
ncbi:pyridoxal phosphate-dependent aminotransferase [Streptomyces sp. 1222.5]|uniref:pyridoxal phosphate-dependent aminotransferase n=1 Tax=Streptomyces sp. 1222.5 TaxID=1881026 RepID=UPI003EB9D02A